MKLLKLSLTSKRGIPRRAINRRNANITLALFTSTVTSKCTARVTQHVKNKKNSICSYSLWKKNHLYSIRVLQNLTLRFQRRDCNRPGTKVMLESPFVL